MSFIMFHPKWLKMKGMVPQVIDRLKRLESIPHSVFPGALSTSTINQTLMTAITPSAV
jgi:hypothetical protein